MFNTVHSSHPKAEALRFLSLEKLGDLINTNNEVSKLLEILEFDPSPMIRHEVCFQIYKVCSSYPRIYEKRHKSILKKLMERYSLEESMLVRHEILEIIPYFGEPETLLEIKKIFNDKEPDIRSTAKTAYGVLELRLNKKFNELSKMKISNREFRNILGIEEILSKAK